MPGASSGFRAALRMTPTPKTGFECFDELIPQLRAEGYDQAAARLHALLHETAWTTGSELMGELGLALRAFERTNPAMSSNLRRRFKTCKSRVAPVWPAMK